MTNEANYDAGVVARAWLSVALASGKDADVPALNRTVLVERFAAGLRFVPTDRYIILQSFAPNLDHDVYDEPSIDEAPDDVAIAIDQDGRAKGLLGYLLGRARFAAKEGLPIVEVTVSLNVTDDEDAPTLGGMEARYVRFDYQAQERLQLDTYGGQYPTWRAMIAGLASVRTEAIGLNPEIIGRLAKLGKLHGNTPIIWRFGGETKAAAVEVMDGDPRVSGAVMPIRLAAEDLA